MDFGHILTIIALLLTIPLAVTSNLLTPMVKDWWGKSSAKRAAKRIVRLEREYEKIANFKQSKNELFIEILEFVIFLIVTSFITLLIPLIFVVHIVFMTPEDLQHLRPTTSIHIVRWFVSVEIYIALIWISLKTVRCLRIMKNVRQFDNYKMKMEEKLETLRKITEE